MSWLEDMLPRLDRFARDAISAETRALANDLAAKIRAHAVPAPDPFIEVEPVPPTSEDETL